MAHRLHTRGIIDGLVWLCPRVALCSQAEHVFVAPWLRHLIGHQLEIKAAPGNPLNADGGTFGYATTFDAADDRIDLHIDYFRRKRTGLIIDEGHHIVDGSTRHRKLAELVKLAPVTLLASGTFQRHDEQQVAFLDYGPLAHGKSQANLENTAAQQVFRYDWRNALNEEAIIPLVFHHVDGSAQWRDNGNNERLVDRISAADDDDARSAIFTVLQETYALELLSEAVAHFNSYRQRHPHAKFLCIAPRKKLAQRFQKHIQRLGLPHCGIATSDDTADALRNIERLKGNERPHLDALVTVAMAYEGMDCPSITHVALLTHIRSMPWIYQALARATRFDDKAGAWSTQAAHIWCPDDPLMNSIITTIRAQQQPFMRERSATGGGNGGDRSGGIVPMNGSIGAIRASEFETGFATSDKEYRDICAAAERNGVSASPLALKRFIDDVLEATGREDEDDDDGDAASPLTPTQRTDQLKKWCDAHVHAVAEREGEQAGERAHAINSEIIRRCGKNREVMTENELRQLWYVDLPRWYPL
jgi:superfamily II DNA or RNA helicase